MCQSAAPPLDCCLCVYISKITGWKTISNRVQSRSKYGKNPILTPWYMTGSSVGLMATGFTLWRLKV